MSKHELPEYLEVETLCREQAVLSGDLKVSNEGALEGLIAGDCELQLSLKFKRDERCFQVIEGHLRAQVPLICQRCLEPLDEWIESNWLLSPVGSEHALEGLPAAYDPWLAKTELISLRALVEEELMLSLPLVPRHGEGLCPVDLLSEHLVEK